MPPAAPPDEFLCPITGELLREPVTLSSGKTYERAAILEWFEYGNTTCPLTRQVVHTTNALDVNTTLQRTIQTWHQQLTSSRDTDAIPLLSSAPLQAFSGHFLLPAPQPLTSTSATVPELIRAIRSSNNADWQEQLIRQLLMAAADCTTKREEIAACGAVPMLVNCALTGTQGVRWQAAEVLSYLSLAPSIRTAILSSLHTLLREHGFDVEADSPEQTVEVLNTALRSRKEATRTLVLWALWVLSIWDYLRGLMARKSVMDALVGRDDWRVCIVNTHMCTGASAEQQELLHRPHRGRSVGSLPGDAQQQPAAVGGGACGARLGVSAAGMVDGLSHPICHATAGRREAGACGGVHGAVQPCFQPPVPALQHRACERHCP